jgi:hypothetical protein
MRKRPTIDPKALYGRTGPQPNPRDHSTYADGGRTRSQRVSRTRDGRASTGAYPYSSAHDVNERGHERHGNFNDD